MSLLLAAAVFCAYFVKGICGFANMLVFGTILSFSRNTVNITPIDLVNSLSSNTVMLVKERKYLDAKLWMPLAAIVIAGCIPGAVFLKLGNGRTVKLIFGLVVILIGLDNLAGALKKRRKRPGAYLLIISMLSGILCGLYGVGALLAAAMSERTKDMHEFRANLCAVFLCNDLVRTILYCVLGIFTAEVLKTALLLYPVMFAGLFLGMLLSKKVPEKTVRVIVSVLLAASGVSLVVLNL